METRANHVWVGAITLLLLALLAAFFVWLVQLGGAAQKEYDIFFPQAVEGLAEGSQVTFSGVPVGKVDVMQLWKKDPQFVQVRGGAYFFLPGLKALLYLAARPRRGPVA